MALTRQVHAVDTDDLTEYRGHLTDADMLRLDAVLRRALGYEVVHGLPPPNRGDSRLRHRAAGGRALGMKMGSFYTAVSRSRAWKNRRYDFVIEEISEDEFKKEYAL